MKLPSFSRTCIVIGMVSCYIIAIISPWDLDAIGKVWRWMKAVITKMEPFLITIGELKRRYQSSGINESQ